MPDFYDTLDIHCLLSAIAEIETGSKDDAVGKKGEISRYQILPSVWDSHLGLPRYLATDEHFALAVAEEVMVRNYERLKIKSLPLLILAWHRGVTWVNRQGIDLLRPTLYPCSYRYVYRVQNIFFSLQDAHSTHNPLVSQTLNSR